MITLQQFRETGTDVEDISEYTGVDYGSKAPGRVYMDGTLSIEANPDGGGWILAIGNQEYLGEQAKLEEVLYGWAKDEYGSMFDNDYRIPPCPINPTEAQMRGWFEGMEERRLMFHPDDDPVQVVDGLAGRYLFHANEIAPVRKIMKDLFRMHGDRVHQVANEVSGIPTGEEE